MTTGKLANFIRSGACAKWSTREFGGSTPFMDGHIVWNGTPLTEVEVEASRADWVASVAADKARGEWEAAMAAMDVSMPRSTEEVIGTMSDEQKAKLPKYTSDAYAAKVKLRGEKP
tara:strand:+ start:847 stop:1194 length:348 start_codon:yes stop_codon:yes gene_type:complete